MNLHKNSNMSIFFKQNALNYGISLSKNAVQRAKSVSALALVTAATSSIGIPILSDI